MSTLSEVLADADRFDLNPVSKYIAPYPFRAYGTIAHDKTVPCCAMETICVALGDLPEGVHRQVNPFLSALVRAINDRISNDEVRTVTLWPYLPKLIDTGIRQRQWEQDLYTMILDRPMSVLESSALLDLPAEQVSYAVGQDLETRDLGSTKLTDLLRYAVRTYWATRVTEAQDDWLPSQIFRIRQYARDMQRTAQGLTQ